MLYFSLTDDNTIVFYTPTKLPLVAGEQLDIDFTADYSLKTYSITSSIQSYTGSYIKFTIPSESLANVNIKGGFYNVALITSVLWEDAEDNWDAADYAWNEGGVTYDTERGWIYEFVSSSVYTSSFETASYTTHSINITEYVYTSSFETASYYTASISGDGGSPYISVRETATYYVYYGN
jgi:hypothetical protein